jgi:hypothetical protein
VGAIFIEKMDVTIRSAPQQVSEAPVSHEEFTKNDIGASVEAPPVDNDTMPQTVLDVLGIDDFVRDLPSEEVENLNEICSYLNDQLKSQGKIPTALTMGRKLDEIREELEMDDQTEPSVLLDRLGGVVKAWKNLGFMSDPKEKRSMFMKLARCPDSRSMHKLIFSEMSRYDW